MLAILKQIEQEVLPGLLREPDDSWSTLDVIYHPPHVERVWRQHGDVRVFLHRIWPCDTPVRRDDRGDLPADRADRGSLWHPHDWPSAMKVVTGSYEMGIGFHPPNWPKITDKDLRITERMGKFVTASTMELTAGSYYEMTEPLTWHYVRPLGEEPAHSLMVAGPLYPKTKVFTIAKPEHPQPQLNAMTRGHILATFRGLYLPAT